MAQVRRLQLLEAWVAEGQFRDWVDGDWDCLMAACHWAARLTGVDPGAPWRGTYHTAEAAQDNLDAGGGMVRLVDRTLRPLGWRRTREPVPGDFGVITLVGGPTRYAAVRYGTRWVLATSQGQLLTEARLRAAWTWPME